MREITAIQAIENKMKNNPDSINNKDILDYIRIIVMSALDSSNETKKNWIRDVIEPKLDVTIKMLKDLEPRIKKIENILGINVKKDSNKNNIIYDDRGIRKRKSL
jgi:hypothetical protein